MISFKLKMNDPSANLISLNMFPPFHSLFSVSVSIQWSKP